MKPIKLRPWGLAFLKVLGLALLGGWLDARMAGAVEPSTEASAEPSGDVESAAKSDAPSPIAPNVEKSATQRFIAVGKLARRGTTRQGRPRFALLDQQGGISSYVAPTAELDLRKYEGRDVAITARTVSLRTDTPYILAEHVTVFGSENAHANPAAGNVSLPAPPRRPVVPAVSAAEVQLSDIAPGRVVPAQFEEVTQTEMLPAATESYSDVESLAPNLDGTIVGDAGAETVGMLGPSPSYLGYDSCPTCGHAPMALGPGLGGVAPCSCGPPGRLWGRAEALIWWMRGMELPPLLTTSPAGTARNQAGVLGRAGTDVLFGGESILTESRNGGRFLLGAWMDNNQWLGWEVDYLFLSEESAGSNFSSTGSPILARPFFNVLTGQQDAELVAFPGVLSGSARFDASSEFQAATPRMLVNLSCEPMDFGPCYLAPFQGFRVDALLGYRYMDLDESLGIREQLTSVPGAGNPSGFFDLRDGFSTNNTFHGADLGLAWEGYRGPWSMDVMTRLGLGSTQREVAISGATTRTVQGITQTDRGGLLALPSNIGTYSDDKFTVIPEVNVNIGYALTPRMRFIVGYSFLYWSHVVRPGDQIDLNVNPNLIPPTNNIGPRSPSFALHDSNLWLQGLNLGLDYRW